MSISSHRLYLATLAPDAPAVAEKFGFGLEIDEFCTAMNFDTDFGFWDARARSHLQKSDRFILHAPFSELSPCAIDPMVRDVTRHRLLQAVDLCKNYGISRMVVHSGFIPRTYFPVWFVEQASVFFRELLGHCPENFELLIENVLDPDPQPLFDMVQAIGDSRAGICLDAGHANVASEIPLNRWIGTLAPFIRHYHAHDNDRSNDLHLLPGDGTMGYPDLLSRMADAAPEATVTFECSDAAGCAHRLQSFGILNSF